MARRYFDKFPEIKYDGYVVKDITTSAKLINRFVNSPYAYNLATVSNDKRPEQVASDYYDDPYLSWLVFYSNKVVDPYYDWPLSEDNFNSLLIKKYGSIEKSMKTIDHFKISWESDNTELSVSQFRDFFGEYTDPHSKYWDAVYDEDSQRILYYVRKQNDAVVNTNKLSKVAVSNNTPTKFSAGDLVDIKTAPNGSTVGTAEVSKANTSHLVIKNVMGAIANSYLIVSDSNSSIYCNVSYHSSQRELTNDAWTVTNISDEEFVYWTAYTKYDVERESNESKKNIKLVDSFLALKVADQLEKELNG